MWTLFYIAVLARVLMATNDIDKYQSRDGLSSISEDMISAWGDLMMEGESPQGEGTVKIFRNNNNNDNKISRDKSPYENSINNLIRKLDTSGSKIFSNYQDNLIQNERVKRSSDKENDNLLSPESLISWTTVDEKDSLPLSNLRDPWQEIKKSRAFSPWGGKRVISYGQSQKVRRPIRIPFNSWGGKRSWFNKISRDEDNLFNKEEKRTKFNAWGGKRSKNENRDDEEIKRNRFNAWGGKRSGKIEKRIPEEIKESKKVFNAWGGKRFVNTNMEEEVKPVEEEALKYGNPHNNNKGQKIEVENLMNKNNADSDEEDDDDNGNNDQNEIRMNSYSNEINELPEKKGSRNYYVNNKSLFNPWGGRKRAENDLDKITTGLNIITPESHHHHTRFWSWGG